MKKALTKTYDEATALFEQKTGIKFSSNNPTNIDIFKRESKRYPFFVGTKYQFKQLGG